MCVVKCHTSTPTAAITVRPVRRAAKCDMRSGSLVIWSRASPRWYERDGASAEPLSGCAPRDAPRRRDRRGVSTRFAGNSALLDPPMWYRVDTMRITSQRLLLSLVALLVAGACKKESAGTAKSDDKAEIAIGATLPLTGAESRTGGFFK